MEKNRGAGSCSKKWNCYPGERLVVTDRHFVHGLAAQRLTLLMLFVSSWLGESNEFVLRRDTWYWIFANGGVVSHTNNAPLGGPIYS